MLGNGQGLDCGIRRFSGIFQLQLPATLGFV